MGHLQTFAAPLINVRFGGKADIISSEAKRPLIAKNGPFSRSQNVLFIGLSAGFSVWFNLYGQRWRQGR